MRDSITFRLNGETRVLHNVSPILTLLNYLREDAALRGTKEGCAEGDCGACTVVIGELVEGKVVHRAVNACIQFIGMLEGKSVLTVEYLQAPGGRLHPVQQAMVDEHGSQCGFCTPGFVMSLYAAYISGQPMDADSAPDLLAGNLCRCTGYGPIMAAQTAIGNYPAPDWEAARLEEEHRWLTNNAHGETVDFIADGQRLLSPASIDDLAACYAVNPDAVLVAGATDVGLRVTKAHRKLGTMIHLGRVRELQTIKRDQGKLTIGAGVTCTDAMATIAGIFPDFGEMIRRFGAVQVRNAGTIGGNIANGSPIGDNPPPLIALDDASTGYARDQPVLKRLGLSLGTQDRIALLGENGNGKTTLLRLIAGLDRHPGNYIAVADEVWQDDARGIFIAPPRRAIGFVFQETHLFPHLSVAANIAYGLKRSGRPYDRPAKASIATRRPTADSSTTSAVASMRSDCSVSCSKVFLSGKCCPPRA